MTEEIANIKLIKVTSKLLEEFLGMACSRIIIAKAGYFRSEVEQLTKLVSDRNIDCAVYVETGENAVRYGFGEQSALKLLENNIEMLNVQSVNQIRMAIVIVDKAVLAYAPVALSWEETPDDLEFPNGFFGGEDLAEALLKQMGGATITLPIEASTLVDIPVPLIPKKTADEVKKEIENTNKSLDENPPVDPAKLRETVVYRNKFKLLKMTVHGTKIKSKVLSLKPFNDLFPQTDKRLKASWTVFTSDDVQRLSSFKKFHDELSEIKSKYTFNVNRHGNLIKTSDIKPFEQKTLKIAATLKDNLLGSGSNQQLFKEDTLAFLLSQSKQALINYLYPLALNETECWAGLFTHDWSLKRKLEEEKVSKEIAIKEALETFISLDLKFPDSKGIIELISVCFDYYDVSNELLEKEEFLKILQGFDVDVRTYNQGFEKNESIDYELVEHK